MASKKKSKVSCYRCDKIQVKLDKALEILNRVFRYTNCSDCDFAVYGTGEKCTACEIEEVLEDF
jgi:hypothetical protein